jgi:hypothetical protein
LHNCQVYDNDSGFKTTHGPFKVVFGSGTKFEVADDSTEFPPHQFCFKNFKEVQAGNFKVNYLYGKIILIMITDIKIYHSFQTYLNNLYCY